MLGLVGALHSQLDANQKKDVDKNVYDLLEDGLQNITYVQDVLCYYTLGNTIKNEMEPFLLRVSRLAAAVATYTNVRTGGQDITKAVDLNNGKLEPVCLAGDEPRSSTLM